jgi:hypothetical protein
MQYHAVRPTVLGDSSHGTPLLLPRKKAGTLHGCAMLGAGFSLLTCAEVDTVVTVAGRVDAMDLAVCMVVMWWLCVGVGVARDTVCEYPAVCGGDGHVNHDGSDVTAVRGQPGDRSG